MRATAFPGSPDAELRALAAELQALRAAGMLRAATLDGALPRLRGRLHAVLAGALEGAAPDPRLLEEVRREGRRLAARAHAAGRVVAWFLDILLSRPLPGYDPAGRTPGGPAPALLLQREA